MNSRGVLFKKIYSVLIFAVCFIVLSLGLSQFSRVVALEGSAAKVDRVSTGPEVTISGRHAPNSEIVVVDSSTEVLAGILSDGTGFFDFSFRVDSGNLSGLKIFAVDQANQTSVVSFNSTNVSNLLLPPSLAINPDIPIREERVGIGGYTFPGATVSVVLTSSSGLSRTILETADAEGGWLAEFTNLVPGTYTAVASSRIGALTSSPSIVLTIIVQPDSLIVQAIPKPVEKAANSVGNAIKNVVQNVLPAPVSKAVQDSAPQAKQVAETVTPVASAGLLTQLLLSGRDIFYILIQGGISALQYFGFWRKRQAWGVVYDALTKQPLMLATVRLYSMPLAAGQNKRLIESDVSSKAGVFSFNPEAGDYQIEVAKPGYNFPTHIIMSQSDGEYSHVYHGERVHLSQDSKSIDVSIPLDPSNVTSLNWHQRIVQFVRQRLYLFTLMMLVIGFVMSLVAVLGGGGSYNILLLTFYITVLLAQWYTYNRKRLSWGNVVDRQGIPVPGVQLNLVDPKFNKLVQRRVSNKEGKYQFVVPPGKYRIDIENVDVNLVKGIKKSYQGQEIWIEGNKPKLINLKIVVDVSKTQNS